VIVPCHVPTAIRSSIYMVILGRWITSLLSTLN